MTKQPRRLSIRVKWSIFISLAIVLALQIFRTRKPIDLAMG